MSSSKTEAEVKKVAEVAARSPPLHPPDSSAPRKAVVPRPADGPMTLEEPATLSPATRQGISEGFHPVTEQHSANASSLFSVCSDNSEGNAGAAVLPSPQHVDEQEEVSPKSVGTAEGFMPLDAQGTMNNSGGSGGSSSGLVSEQR